MESQHQHFTKEKPIVSERELSISQCTVSKKQSVSGSHWAGEYFSNTPRKRIKVFSSCPTRPNQLMHSLVAWFMSPIRSHSATLAQQEVKQSGCNPRQTLCLLVRGQGAIWTLGVFPLLYLTHCGLERDKAIIMQKKSFMMQDCQVGLGLPGSGGHLNLGKQSCESFNRGLHCISYTFPFKKALIADPSLIIQKPRHLYDSANCRKPFCLDSIARKCLRSQGDEQKPSESQKAL